jgi:hypothetical protein
MHLLACNKKTLLVSMLRISKANSERQEGKIKETKYSYHMLVSILRHKKFHLV